MKFKHIITLLLLCPFGLMAQDRFQISGKLSKITGDKSAILSYKNTFLMIRLPEIFFRYCY